MVPRSSIAKLRRACRVATHPRGFGHDARVSGLARRILFAPVVLVAVAVVLYGSWRILRPDLFPGHPLPSGIVHDVNRALLHLDLGCAPPGGTGSGARASGKGMPRPVLWERRLAADVRLAAGGRF